MNNNSAKDSEMTVDGMLFEDTCDSLVHGICMNEGCEYATLVEPDQYGGFCELCCANTVKSGLILAGIK